MMTIQHNSGLNQLLLGCVAILLLLSGCASMETGRRLVPEKLELENTLQLPFSVEKCLLDPTTATYYLLESGSPNVHFYRINKQINILGGLGNDKTNFQKLSDIALDPDGNLLVLDAFARLIRKFSPDGKWIADTELVSFRQPTSFCSTPEGDLLIFESSTKEITKVSGLDGKSNFTFGRFELDSVSSLNCNREIIAAVNGDRNKTALFSAMGQFLKDIPAQLVPDQHKNQYIYSQGALRNVAEEVLLPLGWPDNEIRLHASPGVILLVHDDTVLTIRPLYQSGDSRP